MFSILSETDEVARTVFLTCFEHSDLARTVYSMFLLKTVAIARTVFTTFFENQRSEAHSIYSTW